MIENSWIHLILNSFCVCVFTFRLQLHSLLFILYLFFLEQKKLQDFYFIHRKIGALRLMCFQKPLFLAVFSFMVSGLFKHVDCSAVIYLIFCAWNWTLFVQNTLLWILIFTHLFWWTSHLIITSPPLNPILMDSSGFLDAFRLTSDSTEKMLWTLLHDWLILVWIIIKINLWLCILCQRNMQFKHQNRFFRVWIPWARYPAGINYCISIHFSKAIIIYIIWGFGCLWFFWFC